MTDQSCPPSPVRKRGRPRKTKPAMEPRYPRLAFHQQRQLLDRLRREQQGVVNQSAPMPATGQIMSLANLAEQPRPDIAASIHIPGGGQLRFELDLKQRQTAADYVTERSRLGITGLAPNSRRGLASDWLNWLAFCLHSGATVLPTEFTDLKQFIDMLVAGERKKATIEHHVWAITEVNRRYGCPDPMASELARDYWRDLLRDRLTGEQKQATGMTLDQVEQMTAMLRIDQVDLPARHGKPEDIAAIQAAQRRRCLRDAALINAAYDLATRSAELVAIRWDRLLRDTDGSGAYRAGKSKTDQLGLGQLRYLRPETVRDLDAWQAVAGPSPFVFHRVLEHELDHIPNNQSGIEVDADDSDAQAQAQWSSLTTREIGVIYKRAARLIGISSPTFSGHSTRVGATQDLIQSGGTTEEAQQMGGWRDGRMVARYAERPLAKRAGQNRFNKLAKHRD